MDRNYPLTNMNFLVKVSDIEAVAAFTEVTGVEATVEAVAYPHLTLPATPAV